MVQTAVMLDYNYKRVKQTEDLFTCLVWLIAQQCLHNKRYIYLNRSPSPLALSADVSSQHQKGWLQVQQSGTITLLQALFSNSHTQKTESTLLHVPNSLLQYLHWAVHSNLNQSSSIQLTNILLPEVPKVHKQKAIIGPSSWIPVHCISFFSSASITILEASNYIVPYIFCILNHSLAQTFSSILCSQMPLVSIKY